MIIFVIDIYFNPKYFFPQSHEGAADLDVIKGLIEDTLFSTQPAMVLSLRTSASSSLVRDIQLMLLNVQ